jgi:hypothetical protein
MDQEPLYVRVERAVAALPEEQRDLYELLVALSEARSLDDVNIAAGQAAMELLGLDT